jgi:O-antigen/teichoic acid export membrane protein
MLRRLVLGFGANALGQAINIVIQIFSLPLFLLYWDVETYGTWLLLSALPAYLSMADVGIVSVAGNKMTMLIGRGDVGEANKVYQSAQLFMAIVCCSLVAIVTAPTFLWPLPDYVTLDMRAAFLAALYGVLAALAGGLPEAVFKATGRYPLGTALGQLARLVEWAGFIMGLLIFRNFLGVAAFGLLARMIATMAVGFVAQRGGHGLRLGFRHAEWRELKVMLHPAASFMAFPLANALSFQGVTLLVGIVAGASAVAVFNVYRTIARVAVQMTSMFSHALWPEFARLCGQAGMAGVRTLFRRSAVFGGLAAVLFSPAVYVISPWLLNFWTHGRIQFVPSLMIWMLAYAAVAGIWHVPRVLLMSTNNHIGLSGWYLAAAILSVALAWAMGAIWSVNGVGAAMFLSEAFIALICVHLAKRSFVTAR